MIIESVDSENRVFLIDNFFSKDIINLVKSTSWDNVPWSRGYLQESWARRHLDLSNTDLLTEFNHQVNENRFIIEKKLKIKFENSPFSVWWYDEPEFLVQVHTDGHVPATMQIFWLADSSEYGTIFYNYKNRNSIKHCFKFKINSGYLMLNGLNEDGSQPLLWHGMLNPVNQYRISSYTHFGSYHSI